MYWLDKIICNNEKDVIKINADANVKNQLIKVSARKDIHGIQVIVSVNAINLAMLVNI